MIFVLLLIMLNSLTLFCSDYVGVIKVFEDKSNDSAQHKPGNIYSIFALDINPIIVIFSYC